MIGNRLPGAHERGSLQLDSSLVIGLLVLIAAGTLFAFGTSISCMFADGASQVGQAGFYTTPPEVTASTTGNGRVSFGTEGTTGPFTIMRGRPGSPGYNPSEVSTWDVLLEDASSPATGLDIVDGDMVAIVSSKEKCGFRLVGAKADLAVPPNAPPEISSITVSGVSSNSLVFSAAIADPEGDAVVSRKYILKTSATPPTDTEWSNPGLSFSGTVSVTGLTANTQYHLFVAAFDDRHFSLSTGASVLNIPIYIPGNSPPTLSGVTVRAPIRPDYATMYPFISATVTDPDSGDLANLYSFISQSPIPPATDSWEWVRMGPSTWPDSYSAVDVQVWSALNPETRYYVHLKPVSYSHVGTILTVILDTPINHPPVLTNVTANLASGWPAYSATATDEDGDSVVIYAAVTGSAAPPAEPVGQGAWILGGISAGSLTLTDKTVWVRCTPGTQYYMHVRVSGTPDSAATQTIPIMAP